MPALIINTIVSASILIIVVFVAFVHLSKFNPQRHAITRMLFALLAAGVIVVSWWTARMLCNFLFGILVIGWHPYITGAIQVDGWYRNIIYLSDHRTIQNPTVERFDWLFVALFLIITIILGYGFFKTLRKLGSALKVRMLP